MFIGFYNYTVYLTYLSVAFSLTGIIFAIAKNPMWALIMLCLAGLCDLFDGPIARTKKNRTEKEKQFGIQIDSFCDVISFTVCPIVIGITLKPLGETGFAFSWEQLIFLLLPICGLIRLSWYNIEEFDRQKETEEKRKYYTGIPITCSVVTFPILYLIFQILFPIPGESFYILYLVFTVLVSLSYISKIRFPKPGKLGIAILVAMVILGVGTALLVKYGLK